MQISKVRNYMMKSSTLLMGMATIAMPASQLIAHADTVMSDNHVGKYHLTITDGWSNDLQSIVWNDAGKYYDLYFLHSETADSPDEAGHQNWYHTTTKDFVHFTPQHEALKADGPEAPYTWKSAWTGTVIKNNGQIKGVPKGAYVAYFSGMEKHDGGSQNIWAAWSSDDGKTFSHVLNNASPVLDHSWSIASRDRNNECDAAVVYWHGKMLMYIAEGDKIGVYQSHDGIKWTKADPDGASKVMPYTFMRGLNTQDSVPVECPVLHTMETPNGQKKTVLFYGAKAPKNGQTTGTYYVVGHLDRNGLFVPETDARRLDQGSDYYGANFSGSADLNKSSKMIKTMGWIGNWNYVAQGVHNDEQANSEFTKHLGSYSVARNAELNNNLRIEQTPVTDSSRHSSTKEYRNLSKDHPANGANSSSNRPFTRGRDTNGLVHNLFDVPNANANQEYTLDFSNTHGNYRGRIYVDIWQGGDWVKLNFDPSNGWYRVQTRAGELDKSRNGRAASSYYYDGALGNGLGYSAQSGVKNKTNLQLKIYTDKNSVEIFFPNGEVYTVARFSSSNKQDFKVFTEDPTNGNRLTLKQTELNH